MSLLHFFRVQLPLLLAIIAFGSWLGAQELPSVPVPPEAPPSGAPAEGAPAEGTPAETVEAPPEPFDTEASPDAGAPPVTDSSPAPEADPPADDGAVTPPASAASRLRIVVSAVAPGASMAGIRIHGEDGREAITAEDGSAEIELGPGPQALRFTLPLELTPAHPGPDPRVIRLEGIDVGGVARAELRVTLSADGTPGSLELRALAPEPEAPAQPGDPAYAPAPGAPEHGQIVGTVTARTEGTSVQGVSLFIEGLDAQTTSDAAGQFRMSVPAGRHKVWVIHDRFPTLTLDVEVRPGRDTQINVRLEPPAEKVNDWVIMAPHIEGGVAATLVERRASSNVTDVIGAEEMSRSGASDAAGALRRVTGINVVGGKFIYVRGMGERYSATLLNGQMIPSPDPERRVIPLDLFPTQVLESVVIQKTFSPDIPAEFGGGTVLLRTRSYPQQRTVQVGLSLGLNTQTSLRKGPVYDGGSLDFLGTDDGTRALPDVVRQGGELRRETAFEDGLTAGELAAIGRALPNSWNVYRSVTPPDYRLTLTLGDRFELGSVPVGVLASAISSSAYNRTELSNRNFVASAASEGGLQLTDVFRIETLEQTVTNGGILALGAELTPNHELRSTTLLLRVTDDSVDVVTGYNDNVGRQVRGARLRYIERQLITEQLTGHHEIQAARGASVDWAYAYAQARLDEPDRREYLYFGGFTREDSAGPYALGGEPERLYTELEDQLHDLKLSYTQPFGIWSSLEAKAKVGMSLVFRDRESDIRRYKLFPSGRRISDAVLQQTPEDILAPENFGDDGVELDNVTDESDTYLADQRLQAGFLMAEIPIVKGFELMGGARVERSRQNVITTSRFNPGAAEEASLENTDVLPAATATWRWTDDMALRGGFGRTVSRPEFRELANVPFYDVTTNTAFSGNPELERATINSYDLRWEWYLSSVELLSVGGFYKTFDQPIELVAEGSGDSFSWANASSATNYGLEVEGRRGLDVFSNALTGFFVAFNLAYIQSDVDLRETTGRATSRQRPLQGQAPFVINAQLGYDDSASGGGTAATLLYNVTGKWIANVGVSGAPDIYQEPVHQLDFSGSQRLPAGLTFTFRASNLLNPKEERLQGGQVVREFRSGRSFSLGLSWAL